MDFALWKKEREGEPSWDSPWGKGRPGWHIECSAMAMKLLGDQIDIHGGGRDLIFPHHENEIAQSEAATSKRFARYWIHNGLLTMRTQKMAKSTGNVFNLSQALERFGGETVRYYLLSAHYRSPLDYREETLREAASSLERIQNFLQRAQEIQEEEREAALSRNEEERVQDLAQRAGRMEHNFVLAMDDDFSTPLVFSSVFEAVKLANLLMRKGAPLNKDARDTLLRVRKEIKKIGEVLSLFGDEKKDLGKDASQFIDLLVDLRDKLREKKDWKLADEIRKKLSTLGIELEDTRTRTVWRPKEQSSSARGR